jgi:hypothetical protein
MREILTYCRNFLSDWVALMSGIASVILVFVGIFHGPVPNSYIWIAAGLYFLLASYRVWLQEHHLVLASKVDHFTIARRNNLLHTLSKLDPHTRQLFFDVLLDGARISPVSSPEMKKFDKLLHRSTPFDRLVELGLIVKDNETGRCVVSAEIADDAKAIYVSEIAAKGSSSATAT